MAPVDNLTCVLHGCEDLRLEQRPIPVPKDDQVLIEMDCVGICGTDIHFWKTGKIGPFTQNRPVVIGHESSGVVCKLGKNVKTLKVGDRVAIEPIEPCRHCDLCKAGQYYMCPELALPTEGNLTRYYAHVADMCFKLPDHVTMEEGAILEPLAVGVHACKRAGLSLGSEALILGAGPIGLVTLIAAKAMGASKIIVTDLLESRLTTAKELGATDTVLIKKGMEEKDINAEINKIIPGGPDRAFDCSGVEQTARLGILATRCGGVVTLVGNGPSNVNVPLVDALNKELDIRGCFRYCNDYPAALALVASGSVNVKKLISHHFDIKDTLEAFNTSRNNIGNPIKVMIHVQPRDKNNPKPF